MMGIPLKWRKGQNTRLPKQKDDVYYRLQKYKNLLYIVFYMHGGKAAE